MSCEFDKMFHRAKQEIILSFVLCNEKCHICMLNKLARTLSKSVKRKLSYSNLFLVN